MYDLIHCLKLIIAYAYAFNSVREKCLRTARFSKVLLCVHTLKYHVGILFSKLFTVSEFFLLMYSMIQTIF